jgi:hypothetical protein
VYDLALLHEELVPEAALRLLAIWQANGAMQDQDQDQAPRRANAGSLQAESATTPRGALSLSRPKVLWDEHAKSRQESA